jgi:hypothetical protein
VHYCKYSNYSESIMYSKMFLLINFAIMIIAGPCHSGGIISCFVSCKERKCLKGYCTSFELSGACVCYNCT